MGKVKFVGDVVTVEEMNKWEYGNNVLIDGGTGTGKTHWATYNLGSHAKLENRKVLIIQNRSVTRDEVSNGIINNIKFNKTEGKNNIFVITYQALEESIVLKKPIELGDYDYLVIDEYQHAVQDGGFNNNTILSLNYLLNQRDNIKIWMSATGKYIDLLLDEYFKFDYKYEIKSNYSIIKNLYTYNSKKDFKLLIEDSIRKNIKTLVFSPDIEAMQEIHDQYKPKTGFIVATGNKKIYNNSMDNIRNKLVNEKKFDCLVLLSTSVNSTGINIKDAELKRIIIDNDDPINIIQSIGRKRQTYIEEEKRFDDTDVADVFIRRRNYASVAQKKRRYIENNMIYETLERSDNVSSYFRMGEIIVNYNLPNENSMDKDKIYRRSKTKDFLIFNNIYIEDDQHGEYIVNKLGKYRNNLYSTINNAIEEHGFDKILSNILNYDKNVIHIDSDNKLQLESIAVYLDSVAGEVMLQVKDRKELIEKLNVRRDGKLLKSLDSLNSSLKEGKIPFKIEKFQTSRMIDGKKKNFKSAWKVTKVK